MQGQHIAYVGRPPLLFHCTAPEKKTKKNKKTILAGHSTQLLFRFKEDIATTAKSNGATAQKPEPLFFHSFVVLGTTTAN